MANGAGADAADQVPAEGDLLSIGLAAPVRYAPPERAVLQGLEINNETAVRVIPPTLQRGRGEMLAQPNIHGPPKQVFVPTRRGAVSTVAVRFPPPRTPRSPARSAIGVKWHQHDELRERRVGNAAKALLNESLGRTTIWRALIVTGSAALADIRSERPLCTAALRGG